MASFTVATVLLLFGFGCVLSFKLGILMSETAVLPGFPSTGTSGGAITLALREAKVRYGHGRDISIRWEETKCDEALSMVRAYELGKNVSVIIGPACEKPMDIVAKLMSVLRPYPVPTVTWLPRPERQNDTAISTYWTFTDITEAFILVLKTFAWKNIGIIYSKEGICSSLQETFNNEFPNQDLEITRNLHLAHFTSQEFEERLTEVKNHATVIIVCLPSNYLFEFLTVADQLGMTAANAFVYIYCRFGPNPNTDLKGPISIKKDDRNRIIASLLQIGLMNMDAAGFDEYISNVSNENATLFPNCCQMPDEFANGLYETILAVSEILAIAEDTNTTANMSSLRKNSLGQTANLETLYKTMNLYHYQAGVFETVAHISSTYNHVRDIVWPTGRFPPDPRACGSDGQQCVDKHGVDNGAIVGGCVSIAVIIVAVVFLYIFYRKSKYEKELISMIWKVSNDDIKMRRPRGATQSSVDCDGPIRNTHTPPRKRKLMRAETKGTLGLGSTSSIDKTVLFAPVGNYKGTIVAVKNIQNRTFALTRDVLRDLKTLRELQHENLNPFIGISMEPGKRYILTKYCSKGSLQDVLENDDIKLDNMFQMSFLMDLARGLDFIHRSPLKSHGNLKSCNCVIDSRWVLKLTDYGAIVAPMEDESKDTDTEYDFYAQLLWIAPELLRLQKRPRKGTQKGDVFSFSIIMQEIILRCPPYYFNNAPSSKYIVNRLRCLEEPPYRPRIAETTNTPEKMQGLMIACWHKSPDWRPDVHTILKTLIDINGRRKINIMDNMIKMLEAYSNNLEELVADRTEELAQEKQKTDRLLYQMLPPSVAEQLKRGEHVVPETYSESSLFFSDIVGFTNISGDSTPLQVIDLLNDLYTTFDEIIGMHDVYKVETIGDAYMVASGIPNRNGCRHAGEIANMALDLLSAVTKFRIRHLPGAKLQLRIGLHTGPCAAGVVGLTMPRYCLFGDTINMASRMESTGQAFHIHVSTDMADALAYLQWGFQLLERGIIEVKGKGLQKTYWLVGKDGYSRTLPDEMQVLAKELEDAKTSGRPMSPTDTHISTGSNHESQSMYGNIFRRASFAVRFIRKLSQNSRESSPSGSRLSVKETDNNYSSATLNIPCDVNGLASSVLAGKKDYSREDRGYNSDGTPISTRKKKKKKRKSKSFRNEKCVGDINLTDDHKSPIFAQAIPTIEITPQNI